MSQGKPHFADDLMRRSRALRHPLCVGIDPHLGAIPEAFREGQMTPTDPRTSAAVERFCCAAVDRLQGRVAIVKPQIAFFEQLGWRGLRCLEAVVERAWARGLRVLLDAKRGDIGSTASAYVAAYLGAGAALPVDAVTLNPWLGRDTLEPWVAACEAQGRGVFALVKTSNPGSGDLQDRIVDGRALFEHAGASFADFARRLAGPATGWSSFGAVVGATHPEQAARAREAMPQSLFLVPGYGAQGGSAADAVRGFVPGPAGREGGVVNSSRALLFPPDASGGDTARWEAAFDAAVVRAASELGEAIAR